MKSAAVVVVVVVLALVVVIPVITFLLHAALALIPALAFGGVCYMVGVHRGERRRLSPSRRSPTLKP